MSQGSVNRRDAGKRVLSIMFGRRRVLRNRLAGAALVGAAVAALMTGALGSADPGACAISGPSSAYSVKVCITAPTNFSTVTGAVPITATVTVTGTSPGVQRTRWYLNGSDLLTDFASPHSFTLTTTDFADGAYTIEAAASMRDGFISARATIQVTFANGIGSTPVNTAQWQLPELPHRPWGQPTVVAAAGDGAGGEVNATNVVSLMTSWNPDLFLYLGDVYQEGTLTEFRNWYGTAGTFFDRFRSITAPVVGNHEYNGSPPTAPGYFSYWDNIPHYYSFDVNGWHFAAIDSTSQYNQTAPGTAQYEWLAADLAATSSPCVVVYAHHPLYTIGSEEPATRLQSMWALMRQHGVSAFLTAHDHNYQHWTPMDGGGAPDPGGVAEFIVGTGGHSSQAVVTSDFRVVKRHKSYGAFRMDLYGNHANISYSTSAGALIEQDVLACKGSDGIAPEAPAGLAVTSSTETAVGLQWAAAADNFGVTGYRVYRNGAQVGTTSGATSFADTGVAGATTYVYTVAAVDAAGNESAPSAAATTRTPGADVTPPSVPSSLQLDPSIAGEMGVSWAPSTDNTAVDHYTVYRDGVALGDASTTAFGDSGLGSGVEYCYAVSATDSAGNTSARSAPTCGRSLDTTPPTQPDGLTGVAIGPSLVRLDWNAATDNVGVAGYDVYRNGTKIGEASGTTYDDTIASPLLEHEYRVVAFDAAGLRSSPSDPVTVSTIDSESPTTPGNVAASATGPNSVAVTWSASTDNVGVTGYVVSRNGAAIATVDGATLSYTDPTVLSDTTYGYAVAARDAVGHLSGASSPATVTTPTPAPIIASADAYVSANNPTTNYGTATGLRSDSDPVRRPYLTFNVSGAQAQVTRVRLRVYAATKSTTPITIRKVNDASWGERTITWASAPPPGATVGTAPAFGSPGWVEVDITPAVTGNGPVSVAIDTTSTTSATYASRETATTPRILVDSAP